MKTYTLTSTAFTGDVVFEFDDAGRLVSFNTSEADLSAAQKEWILHKLPTHLALLKNIISNSETAVLTELKQEITFDRFWDRYNSKDRSSKKRTLARWKRMTKTQRIKAFQHIPKYEMTLKPGIDRKFAETYLNAELWNN